ncbi:MAG: CinA family nicotinamide mononucleotide deamidase-related protein [Chloroflexi bacterium]|nr:CinA family nicotinamide mononucleotide deamidase-related protein [Chloroflexota bacterium]
MRCEIIAIGSELLLGAIVDTNSPHIAGRLHTIGLELLYTSAVGDHEARIADSIRLAMSRSEVVITTGGLGPTVDDMTREAVARATGRALIFDEALLGQIEQRFLRLGRTMTENNRRQAFRPKGSTVIENPVGTAPSFIVDTGRSVVISLPGVPREMEYLLDSAVLPYLRRRFSLTGIIKSRTLHVSGLGESVVDQQVGDLEKLENPTVGLNAHSGVVDIRITARADSEAEADRLNAEVERAAREKLGDAVFGADADTLEGVTLARLAGRGEQVAVVEIGTLGRLSGRLAQADNGRGTFRGGQTKPALDPGADAQTLARDAAEQFGAACGLACVVRAQNNTVEVSVGLWRAGKAGRWARGFGGHPGLAPEWAANMALDALRKALAG